MEPEPMDSDSPLSPVGADDLKRVLGLIRSVIDEHGGAIGIDAKLIAEQCGPGADAHAVFLRAALLHHLFEAGLLDNWREGNEPAAIVFQVGAVFPMEQGVAGSDPADFIETLRSKERELRSPDVG